MATDYDAVVVGSGPNGLAAAITLARAGYSVLVLEANSSIGGGARSTELTLPGFVHDVCSAVHPLAAGSPFFKTLPLARFGLTWIQPEIPLAHPLDDETAACLHRDVDLAADSLGEDSRAYRRLMKPLVRDWEKLATDFLQPMLHFPKHPLALARFVRQPYCAKAYLNMSQHARCLPESLRIHFCRWKRSYLRRLRSSLERRDMRWAGQFHAAVRRRSRTRSPLILPNSAARSTSTIGSRISTICQNRALSCSTSHPGNSSASRAINCRHVTADDSKASGTPREFSKLITR